jgi:hypothetical protein
MITMVAIKKFEITPQMIEAGAEILWNDPFLDIGPSNSRDIAEKIIRRAFEICRNEIPTAS